MENAGDKSFIETAIEVVQINELHAAHGESRRLTRRRGKRVNTTVKPLRITGLGEFSVFVTILVIVFLVLVLFIVFVVGVTYIVVAFVVGLDLVARLLRNHLVCQHLLVIHVA